MKQFDYTEKWKKLLTPEIVSYLTTIHEYKGKQYLIIFHLHQISFNSFIEIYINLRMLLTEEDSRLLIILLRKRMKRVISLLDSDPYLHGKLQTQL